MEIKKEALRKLYNDNLSKDVCNKLGISNPTLNKLLRKAGIPLKGKGNPNAGKWFTKYTVA